MTHVQRGAILWLAVIASSVLLVDILQYLAYTKATNEVLIRTPHSVTKEAGYKVDWWVYKVAGGCCYTKVLLLIADAVVLARVFSNFHIGELEVVH